MATQMRYLKSNGWLKEGSIGDLLTNALIERIERAPEVELDKIALTIPADEAAVSSIMVEAALKKRDTVFIAHYARAAERLLNDLEKAFKMQMSTEEAIKAFLDVESYKALPPKFNINHL